MFKKIRKFSIKATTFCNMNCVYCHQLENDKNKARTFEYYEELEKFLLQLDFDDTCIVTITGGEITTAENNFLKILKVLKNVSKQKDVKFEPAITTNGTNFDMIKKWIELEYVHPKYIDFSWDGLNTVNIRKSKNPIIQSDISFFNKIIKEIGDDMFLSKNITVSYALTPYNIFRFERDFQYAVNNGIRNFSYYLIHEGNYNLIRDKDNLLKTFFKVFYSQLELIWLHGKNEYNFFNVINMFSKYCDYNTIELTQEEFQNLIRCKKLGNGFHIDTSGDIYPCIYFGDHQSLCIGNILDGGFYKDKVDLFIHEYFDKPFTCNSKVCKNYHCFECPASVYVANGNMNDRFKLSCYLHTIERQAFYIAYNRVRADNYECSERLGRLLYMPECNLNYNISRDYNVPLATQTDHKKEDKNILSDNYKGVQSW